MCVGAGSLLKRQPLCCRYWAQRPAWACCLRCAMLCKSAWDAARTKAELARVKLDMATCGLGWAAGGRGVESPLVACGPQCKLKEDRCA
eukprot:2562132-Pleurochrysis_carterae.AAC.1